MAYPFTVDDVRFLTGPGGSEALRAADRLPITDATLLADLTAARKFAGEHAAAVIETVRLRRRAVPKLGERAATWLLTDEALQQASPWPVALHRARRFARSDIAGVHDVTCSIGTDLAALAAAGSRPVLGSDLDPVRLAMAGFNVPGVTTVLADALSPVSTGLWPYADPARRSGGRRITTIETIPSVAELEAAYSGRPPVLRLPPGIDYDTLARPGEAEIVSLAGAAREAVLWPERFTGGVRRRATVLSETGTSWDITDLDDDGGEATAAGPVDEWIVDPDPAVVRAHLVRHYAARHGLHLLDSHLAYLTGPQPPPGVRAFRVLDIAPFTEKVLAGWLRRDGIGTLEIKQRGTPVVPEDLRRRVRKAMGKDTRVAATVVIARIGDTATAYWCRASPPPGRTPPGPRRTDPAG